MFSLAICIDSDSSVELGVKNGNSRKQFKFWGFFFRSFENEFGDLIIAMKKVLLSILFLLIVFENIACGCISEGKLNRKIAKKYDLIITGKIIKVESDGFISIFTIEIDENFKNKKNKNLVTIYTPQGSCELTINVGQYWLIFAKICYDNSYKTDVCMRNKIMDSESEFYTQAKLKADLDFLRRK